MGIEEFNMCLWGMVAMGVVVFVALFFVNAGYGIMNNGKWGVTVDNKVGWVLMECPVFFVMLYFFFTSERTGEAALVVMLLLFELHYFQRSFVFPLMMKGKSRMPIAIMLMGVAFNLINGGMQGYWLFHLSEEGRYGAEWLSDPRFIIGVLMFFAGMGINLHSDSVIRNLRKPGDTGHYLPKKGFYRYVTSANYFGEFVEWCGWAVLTWSFAGFVFAFWTFANLAPRANALNKKYWGMFAAEMEVLRPKRMVPFVW